MRSPMTQQDRSEARKTAILPTSFGWPIRRQRRLRGSLLLEIAADDAGRMRALGLDHAGRHQLRRS
jgi:hypothetical protein